MSRDTKLYTARVTAPPRLPRLQEPLPDVDTASEDAILDMVANCLARRDDRDRLADSDAHLIATLQLVETLALRAETHDDRRLAAERALVIEQGIAATRETLLAAERAETLRIRTLNAELSRQLAETSHRLIDVSMRSATLVIAQTGYAELVTQWRAQDAAEQADLARRQSACERRSSSTDVVDDPDDPSPHRADRTTTVRMRTISMRDLVARKETP